MTSGDGVEAAGRRCLLRLLVPAVLGAIVYGVPELALRFSRIEVGAYTAIEFGGDANSRRLFVRDPRLHWALRPGVDLEFTAARVRTNAHGLRGARLQPSTAKVLCVGDSATFGWAVEEQETYPYRLERLLNGPGRKVPWQVANAGVPGYSSHQVRRRAEALIGRLRPRVVVVYTGNNDAWPAPVSDADVERSRRLLRPVLDVAARSRLVTWLGDFTQPEPAAEPYPLGADTVARVDLDGYAENLRAMIAAAAAAGAQVVVVIPAVNLDHPPPRLGQLDDWPEWQSRWQRVIGLIEAERPDRALAVLTRMGVLRAPEPSFYGLWLEGLARWRLGEVEAGLELLERALELHPSPERARRSYRRRAATVAAAEGAAVVDAHALLLRAARRSKPVDWFVDWCHPRGSGHALIAGAVFERIER